MIDVLVIVAGTNEPSNANMLADAFAQGIQQSGAVHVHKRRLKSLKIEQFQVDFYAPQCNMEEDFCALQDLMQRSKGLVIATPVWNFSVPGHLKNFIDRMGSFALAENRSDGTLDGLPFYLIFTGGAPRPAWTGMMKKTTSHLPEALKYFGGSYIGHHFEGRCTKGRGKFGLVVDERPETLASLRKQGEEFSRIVQGYAKTGKAPLKYRTKGRIMKWGEKILKKVA